MSKITVFLPLFIFASLALEGAFTALQSIPIALSPAQQKNIGIQTAELKRTDYIQKMPAFGTLLDAQSFSVWRTKWLRAKAEWMKSKESRLYYQKDFQRQQELYNNNQNTAQKTLQEAEMKFNISKIEEDAASAALANLQYEIQLLFGSNISKWIIHGSEPFNQLMEKKVYILQVSLPPATVEKMPLKIEVEPFANVFEQATFISEAPSIGNSLQNCSFFYLIQNIPAHPLASGLNVRVYLPLSKNQTGVLIPASAVVWWQGKAWVYIQTNNNHFSRCAISTQSPSDNGWFVDSELAPGYRIVIQGAQEILSLELSPSPCKAHDGKDIPKPNF